MKKLMIAAAVAAMVGGAFAKCVIDEDSKSNGVRVYDFKATVKTVDGKTKTTKGQKVVCKNEDPVEDEINYYRVKANRTFKGLFIDCDTCFTVEDDVITYTGDNLTCGRARFIMTSSASKYKWMHDSTLATYTPALYAFGLVNFFGGPSFEKSPYVEASLLLRFLEVDQYNKTRAYSLLAAGFGKRSGAFVNTLGGSIAGEVDAATYCGINTQVFEPCTEFPYYKDVVANKTDGKPDGTYSYTYVTWWLTRSPSYDAVSGTWTLKYSASKSKAAARDQEKMIASTFKGAKAFDTKDAKEYPFNITNTDQNWGIADIGTVPDAPEGTGAGPADKLF